MGAAWQIDDVMFFRRKNHSNFHVMGKKTEWSIDDGYKDSAKLMSTYPRRALFAGASNAVSITLSASKKNLDYTCKDSMTGFRVGFFSRDIL